MQSTGVVIRRRSDHQDYALHDGCLESLQGLAPEAFDPDSGGFAIIGPMFGPFTCSSCEYKGGA